MPSLDHITSCILVTEADIEGSIGCRADARALVEKMASVSRPNQGASRILAVLARIDNLDWLDGRLRVEIGGDGDVSIIDVLTQLGAGFSERVWPAISVGVPFEEIRRAIKMHPRFILPLKLKREHNSRLVLTAATDLRNSSLPPPKIRVGDAALVWGERPNPGERIPIPRLPRIDYFPSVDAHDPAPSNPPRASSSRKPPPSTTPRADRPTVPRPRRPSSHDPVTTRKDRKKTGDH